MGCHLGCIILDYFTFCGHWGVASGDFVLLLNLVISIVYQVMNQVSDYGVGKTFIE
jgi:hypothetical protein